MRSPEEGRYFTFSANNRAKRSGVNYIVEMCPMRVRARGRARPVLADAEISELWHILPEMISSKSKETGGRKKSVNLMHTISMIP